MQSIQTTQRNIKIFQELQLHLKRQIESLHLPTLGPEFTNLDFTATQDSLIAYRLCKKLSKVDSDDTRATKSVRSMLEYDEGGFTHFNPVRMELDPFVRQMIYKSSNTFKQVLRDFNSVFSNYHFDFPNGESLDSSQGNTSLYDKLRNLTHWKVTPDCKPHFIRLIYQNLWFKRVAMDHVRRHPFYIKHKRAIDRHLWLKYKDAKDRSFLIFSEKMTQFVITLVPGARLATVPKDNEKDRVIEIESLGNMCVQRAIAQAIRKLIEKHFGYDLTMAQAVHQQLIADHSNATIDFSNASNSNWIGLLRFFFPEKVFKLLMETRSPVVTYSGEYYGLNMIAPMGNGFTFEVMSLFLLTIAREFDSLASVFGDDVIIHVDTAPSFIELMTSLGWNINETKSFIHGNFRESCGSFHHTDGYVVSYDFWLVEDIVDMMVSTNKVLSLIPHITNPFLIAYLKEFWRKAIKLFPSECYRNMKRAWQYEDSSLYLYTMHPHAKDLILGSNSSVRTVRLILPPKRVLPLDKGVILVRSVFEDLSKICSSTERDRYKKRKSRHSEKLHLLQHQNYDICTYPVRGKKDHMRRAPRDGVRSKAWLCTYYRFNRVVQAKCGQSLIKRKTIACTGIDIEL